MAAVSSSFGTIASKRLMTRHACRIRKLCISHCTLASETVAMIASVGATSAPICGPCRRSALGLRVRKGGTAGGGTCEALIERESALRVLSSSLSSILPPPPPSHWWNTASMASGGASMRSRPTSICSSSRVTSASRLRCHSRSTSIARLALAARELRTNAAAASPESGGAGSAEGWAVGLSSSMSSNR
eukprot:scaffold241994_cov26-Tisochrysis_lutea.AAC.1